MKLDNNLTQLLIAGGIGVGFYLAWESNFLGIRDFIDDLSFDVVESTSTTPPAETKLMATNTWSYPYNYYPQTGGQPQQEHGYNESFPYPYPPTMQNPMTVAPQTLGGAHYRIAGTPNIRQIPGTTTIMNIPNAMMPNPTLWVDKGGIVTPGTRIALPTAINYGPYKFEAPIFSKNRYPIYGTNIDYPFIIPPFCPPNQFHGQDGRCYPTPVYP